MRLQPKTRPEDIKSAICLFVRDEENDIAEWIAYHSLIGIKTFVVYENASDDNTPEVLDRLRRFYDVKLISWPRVTKYSQLEAYDDCLKNFRETFDWVAFIDSDEFLTPVQDGTINNFLARHEEADAVALNWSVFGSSGHIEAPQDLTTAAFTKRAPQAFPANLHTKMIVRPSKAIRVCDPHYISVEGRVVKADGSDFHRSSLGVSPSTAGFDVCRVNHYFVKSREHWSRKMKRGYREGVRPQEHFEAHDVNEVEDLWAANKAGLIKRALSAISELPLRQRRRIEVLGPSELDKGSPSWQAIRSEIDDLLHSAPAYAREPNNTLFDPDFYLRTNPDVRASGLDAFEHFFHAGFFEGRRPCTMDALRRYVLSKGSKE